MGQSQSMNQANSAELKLNKIAHLDLVLLTNQGESSAKLVRHVSMFEFQTTPPHPLHLPLPLLPSKKEKKTLVIPCPYDSKQMN